MTRTIDSAPSTPPPELPTQAQPARAETPAPADAAVPEGLEPVVQTSVDAVIGEDATPEQRTQAYEEMQARYEAIASGGDFEGVDPAQFQVNATRALVEAGIPTRVRPEVVAAVDAVVDDANSTADGGLLEPATAEQVLQAYADVDAYVDAVGGLGDAGITAEALPARAEALLHEAGIPTDAASAEAYVAEPLQGFDDMSPEARIDALNEATSRLESLTADLDPEAAAIVAARALAPIEARIGDVGAAGAFIDQDLAPTRLSLAIVADRLPEGARGDAVLDRIADAMLANAGPGNPRLLSPLSGDGHGMRLFLHIAAGADAAYGEGATAVLMRDISAAQDAYVSGVVEPAVDAYSEHTAELNWLLQNLGPGASPEDLQAATEDYIAANPDWQARHDELQAEMAAHGANLLRQADALSGLPPGLGGEYADDAAARVESLLNGDKSGFAIATAAGTDPEAISEIDLPEMVGFSEGLSLTDGGIGVVRALAGAHVQHNVLGSLATLDTTDPASLAAARAQIATLRDPAIATALGLDPSQLGDLDAAVDELQATLPQNGETLSQADVQSRLQRLNSRLNGLDAFHESQPMGQVFRGIGVAAGVASLWGAATGFVEDPSIEGGIEVLSGAAGLSTAVGELATGLGAIPENSAWARFSSNAALGKVLGTIGIGLGVVGVVDSLSEGDLTQAGIGAVGVGGGALALFGTASWTGPVGVVIGLLAAGASFGVSIFRANEATAELEAASRPFLESLGFDAEAAEVLSDFSGDGYSSVGVLMRYGETRGLGHDDMVAWLNGLPPDRLANVRDMLNYAADDLEGEYGEFGAATGDGARFDDATFAELLEGSGTGNLLIGELTPESSSQLDIALEAMDIELPWQPHGPPAPAPTATELDAEAAEILGDSDGALDVLEQYGALRGLDREQTLGWINAIPPEDLEPLRNALAWTHEDLDGAGLAEDATDGAQFDDGEFGEIAELNRGHLQSGDLVALSAKQIDAVLEAYGVDVPEAP